MSTSIIFYFFFAFFQKNTDELHNQHQNLSIIILKKLTLLKSHNKEKARRHNKVRKKVSQ